MPTKRSTKKVVWEDPPGHRRTPGSVDHSVAAAQLRSRPGQWARIAEYASSAGAGSTAARIRAGDARAWEPAGDYEAVSRTVEGKHVVFARYMGGADDA